MWKLVSLTLLNFSLSFFQRSGCLTSLVVEKPLTSQNFNINIPNHSKLDRLPLEERQFFLQIFKKGAVACFYEFKLTTGHG